MTTDDFTRAARAEAEDYARTPRMNVGTVRDRIAKAYLAGAERGREQALAQEPTDAERAVRALHTPREEQVVTEDCSFEECDHEDECPTVPFLVCAECWRVADESYAYFGERGVGHVAYPCPTIQALDMARAARRDEEKR